MTGADVSICGEDFLTLHHHDGRFLRMPGVFALARRGPAGTRTILYVAEADSINEAAHSGSRAWAAALTAGMTEMLVCATVRESSERRRLMAEIVATYRPPLNQPAELERSAA
jgi:hypothetical protein